MTKRILIVEDDPMIGMMLEEFVALLGFEVACCVDDVAAALDALSGHRIDAAVVDVHLADGETSAPVAEALASAGIPFVVATGGFSADLAPVWEGRPILEKPYTIAGLREAFAQIA